MTDFSLDQIGRRLSGVGLSAEEQVLALDDAVRVKWVRDRLLSGGYRAVIDVGASDGSVTANLDMLTFLIERHPAHRDALSKRECWTYFGDAGNALRELPPEVDIRCVTLFGEILEHLDEPEGADLIAQAHGHLIITVPNANCESYKPQRQRAEWPDHRRQFTAESLSAWLDSCDWDVRMLHPIVGTLDDSIWLGAVCRRA